LLTRAVLYQYPKCAFCRDCEPEATRTQGAPPDFYARLKYFTETLPACEGYLNPFCYKAQVLAVVNNQPDQQY